MPQDGSWGEYPSKIRGHSLEGGVEMGRGERVRDADWTAWDGLNLELVSRLHMHVDSFHGAYEPRDWQVLQLPCSLPTHPYSTNPSSLSTVPSFPAEEISGSVRSLPSLLPTENIYCSEVLSPRVQGPAWGWKGAVEQPHSQSHLAVGYTSSQSSSCQSQLG